MNMFNLIFHNQALCKKKSKGLLHLALSSHTFCGQLHSNRPKLLYIKLNGN